MYGQSRDAAIVTQGRGYAGPDHRQWSALGVRAMALPWAWQDFDMTNALTATLRTNRGTVVVRLFPDHAPKTVRNFVELAEGGREWTDPRTRATGAAKPHDGTIFHRVIPRFMIQGGDPLGTGTGGSRYQIRGEIAPAPSIVRPRQLTS